MQDEERNVVKGFVEVLGQHRADYFALRTRNLHAV